MPETPHITPLIDDNTLISRNNSLLVAPVHDETVMMDIQNGHYYGLDDIGTGIWKQLATPRTFDALVEALLFEYEGDRTVIARDVRELLTSMAAHQVVTLS